MKHVPGLSKDKAGYELHAKRQVKHIYVLVRLFLED